MATKVRPTYPRVPNGNIDVLAVVADIRDEMAASFGQTTARVALANTLRKLAEGMMREAKAIQAGKWSPPRPTD